MQPKPITHGNIFRVLTAGFGLVVILLLAAALVAVRNIHAIRQSAAGLIGEQEVARRLIGELHGQQTSLSEVFSVLARDPDSVDEGAILKQLDAADADTARIAAEGARTADRDLWVRLKQASLAFSAEARHILAEDEPETFAPVELFREHEDFMTVVARLVEREYRTAGAAQAQLNQLTSKLLRTTVIFAGASVLLALLFAIITVRMVSRLIRGMEWQTAELGRVSWHMLEDQEATARRFSHELHDELGQALTAIKTNLAALAAGGQANARARGRLPAPGGRGHRQRAPDVAASAAHHSRRFRTGCRPALAGRGLRRAHRHRRAVRIEFRRPAAGRNRNPPVPHRAGGAHQRGASRRGATGDA